LIYVQIAVVKFQIMQHIYQFSLWFILSDEYGNRKVSSWIIWHFGSLN